MTAVWNASPVMFKNRKERKKEEQKKKKKKEKRKNHHNKNLFGKTVTRLIDSVPVHVSDNTCLTRTVCVIGREL